MNHIWTQINYSTPYQAHLKTQRFAYVKMEKNVVKSLGRFSKVTETARFPGSEFAVDKAIFFRCAW